MHELLFDGLENKMGLFFPVTSNNEPLPKFVTGIGRIRSVEGDRGTGFVFEEGGKRFLISALHCFGERAPQPASITFPWGEVQVAPGELIRFFQNDLLLDLTAIPLSHPRVFESHAFKRTIINKENLEGQPLLALGYPSSYVRDLALEGPAYSVGKFNEVMSERWSRFSAQIRSEGGMSGSPLLDINLDVVGVINAHVPRSLPSLLDTLFSSQRRSSFNHTYGVLLPIEISGISV
jgi:hypothetical protein